MVRSVPNDVKGTMKFEAFTAVPLWVTIQRSLVVKCQRCGRISVLTGDLTKDTGTTQKTTMFAPGKN